MKRITVLTLMLLLAAGIIFQTGLLAADQADAVKKSTAAVTESSDNGAEAPGQEIKKEASETSLYGLFKKGGPFMWPILMMAAVAMGFIVERFLFFRKANLSSREFIEDLENTITTGSLSDVEKMCSDSGNVLSRILLRGMKHRKLSHERVEKSISIAGSVETSKLERGLNVLSSLGNIAPMLGFLGTTSGMISAFADIAAADQVNASIVAGGIEEALLTTAAGLTVAIPTLLFYNYFIHRIDIFVADVERISGDLLEKILEEPYEN